MVYGSSFIYDGICSDTYNLLLCSFESANEESNMGLDTEILYDVSSSSIKRYEYNIKYSGTISLEMTLAKKDFTYFTRIEIREICKWLTGKKSSAWLSILDEEFDDLNYKARVTSISKKKIGGNVAGLIIKWENSSPYAYTSEYTYEYTISQNDYLISFFNDSDDINNYLYPYVEIRAFQNIDRLSIVNTSDNNRLTRINNIVYNEIITMDNENGVIHTNIHDKKILPLFETRKWLRFISGENILKVNGNCNLKISCRFPRKVGDF